MSNDNGVISFENKKRMEARRVKVDETLLQRAEMLTLHAANDGTVTYEQDIRLVPMPFEPDKGPDYWKDKYRRLKERMQELINDKED